MIGAKYITEGRCRFKVWAPNCKTMLLQILHPELQTIAMEPDEMGYWLAELEDILPGTRYMYAPDGGKTFPDPASYAQPDGVHEASEVVDHLAFSWTDKGWKGIAIEKMVIYELHVGTFTPEGTFDGIIARLDDLLDVGINTIEIMPVAQFPGTRNWGYDGVYHFAVQHSYGGTEGLKRLIDACHSKGIAVLLDVVYNHFGPEGNYTLQFGPYFTDKYHTPWGDAINLDEAWSDGVRDYILSNIRYWLEWFHFDGLRLDAVHTIFDDGAVSIWELIHREVDRLRQLEDRHIWLIAESDLNSPRIVEPTEDGGRGMDAQWLDDFHHAVYAVLHPADRNRYVDFGGLEHIAKAYADGFVIDGSHSRFRKRLFGRSSAHIGGQHFIAFNQNHDQAGNRAGGERLSMLVDFERQKLAMAALMCAPYVPMLFMGEEYGEDVPFFYFVSHSDEQLIEAVREGRQREFARQNWGVNPPDPQSEDLFISSKLVWEKRSQGDYRLLLDWTKEWIRMRSIHTALSNFDKSGVTVEVVSDYLLIVRRSSKDGDRELIFVFNYGEQPRRFNIEDGWEMVLHSREARWLSDRDLGRLYSIEGPEIQIPELSVVVFEATR